MTRWYEIRDVKPPELLDVLFYIRDKIDGFTEDYMRQDCITGIEGEGTEEKIDFSFSIEPYEEITHWTLLPQAPIHWR